jgi:hypothetical protein
MSTLITSSVTTENTATSLRLRTGNASAGSITVNSGNTNVTVQGNMLVHSGTVSDSKGDVRDIPLNNQSVDYTLVASDLGKVISTTGNVTIPANIFSSGDPISVFNNTTTTKSLIPAVGVTLYYAGTSLTGTRTLSTRAICTILCVGTNTFVVSGVGIS